MVVRNRVRHHSKYLEEISVNKNTRKIALKWDNREQYDDIFRYNPYVFQNAYCFFIEKDFEMDVFVKKIMKK